MNNRGVSHTTPSVVHDGSESRRRRDKELGNCLIDTKTKLFDGTTVDQVIAQRHGRSTKVPSLVLGCEKSNPSVHKNYSMIDKVGVNLKSFGDSDERLAEV